MKKKSANEFDPERWDIIMSNINRTLQESKEDWPIIISHGLKSHFSAYVRRSERYLRKTLLYWRNEQDPRTSLGEAIELAQTALAFAKAEGLDNAVDRHEFTFIWLSQAASLIDLDFRLPPYKTEYKKSGKDDWLKLNSYIYKRLKDIPTPDSVDSLTSKVTEKKRQTYIQNYRTYEALLNHDNPLDGSFEALVREAEANYNQRRRWQDNEIQGGGFYNPYVRDLTLAAILKKKDWTDESVHQWLWHKPNST